MKPTQQNGPVQAPTKILMASFSAMVAETTTFPIDLTKIRLQLHGELLLHLGSSSSSTTTTVTSTNAFRVASDIVRLQGPLGFYNGLSPAILGHIFRNSLKGDRDSLSLPAAALAGGLSGVTDQLLASPADLVKVRMQADGRFVSQGYQPRYHGCFAALNKISQAEGVGGHWKGVFPNVQRAFLVNMGELACYDRAKRFIIQNHISDDNIYAHTLASIMSGLSATTLSCPADVIKTRMMNRQNAMKGR